MNNYLRTKTKSLPPEVEAYLTSVKAADLNMLIFDKYHLTAPQINAYYDLVAQLYLKEISPDNLLEEIKHIFGFSDNVARQLAGDIAGVRLAVVADWLATDIAGLIRRWGGDPTKYQSYITVQQKAVVEEAKWLAEQLAVPVDTGPEEEQVDWPEQEAKIKEVFAQALVDWLRLDDDSVLGEMNDQIFYLLTGAKETFKDELASALLNNNEQLTGQRIVVDGKPADPTVANWLNLFFQQKGSAMFDALVLSDFITNDPNAKTLNQEERSLLTNLLIVYRNLKFFPDSMSGDDPADWFIFPRLNREAPLARSARPAAPVNQPPSLAPEPIINQTDKQVQELEAMADRYPAGSLERLALEEEIAKLRQQ